MMLSSIDWSDRSAQKSSGRGQDFPDKHQERNPLVKTLAVKLSQTEILWDTPFSGTRLGTSRWNLGGRHRWDMQYLIVFLVKSFPA